MKTLYWNIRGLANTPSRLALKRLITVHKPDLIFVAEPWMNYDVFPSSWLHRLGFKIFAFNDRRNLLPNLWCICALDINPIVHDYDDQQVTCSIIVNRIEVFVTAIYASTDYLRRRQLWQKLSFLQSQHSVPWSFIGDFNAIMGAHENSGNIPPARQPIRDFQNFTNAHDLIHLPTRGVTYTWDNRRLGRRHTKRRLDRAICNHSFLDLCSFISCSTLTNTTSDHYPLLFQFQSTNQTFTSNFKFLKMWTLHDDCKRLISDSWNTRVVGCPMYILCSKLKALKIKLKAWNKDIFGDIHSQVAEAEKNLADLQNHINLAGHSDDLMIQEKNAQCQLDDALNKQEVFWKEKARLNWHVNGDRNTKFFHRISKIKNKTKLISSLRIEEDIITDPQIISNHIVNYYQTLFSTNFVLQEHSLVDEVIPHLIDDHTNTLLTMMPSPAEIKHAVFELNSDGAPGPDGFGASFFQTYWEIVHKDVVAAVTEFFQSKWLTPNFNANTLVLIPKSPNADSLDQFRPIALANFKFKIITKVLADRLANILPTIISKEQRGFIRGRNIKDCIV